MDEDISHYQKIIIALTETIRLMAEIDETHRIPRWLAGCIRHVG